MKMTESNICKTLSLILSLFILVSCMPVILSGVIELSIILLLVLYIIAFLISIPFHIIKLKGSNIFAILYTLFLALYIAIPFREFDRFSPSIIWLLLFPTILMLPAIIVNKALVYFEKMIYFISIASLLVYILFIFNLLSPFYVIDMGGRLYDSFIFSTVLQNQYFSVFGLNLYRSSAIFAEPGHFGLIVSFLLYLNSDILKTNSGKIILFAGLITFSFSFYLLLFMLVIIQAIINKKIKIALMLSVIMAFISLILPNDFLQSFFISKVEGSIDNRTSNYFKILFNDFLYSPDILWGKGRDVLDQFDLASSDYRAFLIRYGILGFLLYIGLLFIFKIDKKDLIVCSLYFFIVFIHRSWFVDYFIFLFFILSMSVPIRYSYYNNKI